MDQAFAEKEAVKLLRIHLIVCGHRRCDHRGLGGWLVGWRRGGVIPGIGRMQDERHANTGVVVRCGIGSPIIAISCRRALSGRFDKRYAIDRHILC